MRHFNYCDAYYEVVEHLKDGIAFQLDVNPKHIDIISIEGEGVELWDEDDDIMTARKVVWRTNYWTITTDEDGKVRRETEYGEAVESAWLTHDSGENDGSDEIILDYAKFMED